MASIQAQFVKDLCSSISMISGMGDMAVSNSIGSNIFDVLLGLGFPWALRTLIVSYGSVVKPDVFSYLYFCHRGVVVWFCECVNASRCPICR